MHIKNAIKTALRDPLLFSEHISQIKPRSYQADVLLSVIDSIVNQKGLSFVVMFPRQSGKNELQALLETYLMTALQMTDTEIVKISPTWKPQSLNAMRRLERTLTANILTRHAWKKESGYIYRVGKARTTFLSGNPEAHIVGQTASTLLEIDEAQDVQIAKYDKEIAPMAASTNATRIFYGTAWTSNTLLARELRAAREAEAVDGIRRAFTITADDVSAEVKPYKAFVEMQIARLGRNHPMIKSQFFSEEIDTQGMIFNASRLAMLQGNHSPQEAPIQNHIYCFLIDVAGSDESKPDSESTRDSTTLSVVEVDLSSIDDYTIAKPIYRIVKFYEWINQDQKTLYAIITNLAKFWNVRHTIIDSTGIGAGLSDFLSAILPNVIEFTFTNPSKSMLGWNFISLIETGRLQLYTAADPLHDKFLNQLIHIQSEINSGPNRILSWSVPDGTRDTATGNLVHDDLVMSTALVSLLDEQPWGAAESTVIAAYDPLTELSF